MFNKQCGDVVIWWCSSLLWYSRKA